MLVFFVLEIEMISILWDIEWFWWGNGCSRGSVIWPDVMIPSISINHRRRKIYLWVLQTKLLQSEKSSGTAHFCFWYRIEPIEHSCCYRMMFFGTACSLLQSTRHTFNLLVPHRQAPSPHHLMSTDFVSIPTSLVETTEDKWLRHEYKYCRSTCDSRKMQWSS